MKSDKRWLFFLFTALVAVAMVAPAGATTLQRASLERLVDSNESIVLATVTDAVSYWSEDGTFILTDVYLSPREVVKGVRAAREVVVTLMGGTVGDLSTVILGGAELRVGRDYVLFLDREDLPGARDVLTVRDHVQGVFDLVVEADELRAVSQAAGTDLVPDAGGIAEAAGGDAGYPLDAMITTIRELAVGR